ITNYFSSFDETRTDHAVAISCFGRIDQQSDLINIFDKITVHGQREYRSRADVGKSGLERATDSTRRSSLNQSHFRIAFRPISHDFGRSILGRVVDDNNLKNLSIISL